MPADEITEQVIKETGYLRDLEMEAARSVEAETRAQNVRELLAATEEFAVRNDPPYIQVFLEEAALLLEAEKSSSRARSSAGGDLKIIRSGRRRGNGGRARELACPNVWSAILNLEEEEALRRGRGGGLRL